MSIRDYIENLRYEREKQQKKETAMKVLSGLAIGTVIGGVIGILFAPKAGKETRQEISDCRCHRAESKGNSAGSKR